MRTLLAAVLIVLGVLACAYGALIWLSIARSDTATWVLLSFGFMFAGPGLVAIAMGTRLLRRARPPAGPGAPPRA
jgi:uncharacterized membrane protein YidH (DUF202 family)